MNSGYLKINFNISFIYYFASENSVIIPKKFVFIALSDLSRNFEIMHEIRVWDKNVRSVVHHAMQFSD